MADFNQAKFHSSKRPEYQDCKAWPTPTKQDGENCGGPSQYERNSLPLNAIIKSKESKGQLNPDWVEWLMGWPVGWGDLEPITELNWLDWETDPADCEGLSSWATPNASARSGRNKNTGKGEGLYYQVREKTKGFTGLIPRITTKKENRINRLKAIGNGQVPQCVELAWKLLTN